MKTLLTPLLVLALALTATSAWAQSSDESVTVLGFTSRGEVGDLTSTYFNVTRAQVEFHPDYVLNDVPEQSLDDLLLTFGCVVLDADCSMLLADVVGSDLLLHGEVGFEDGVASVRFVMWDLMAGTERRVVSHSLGGGLAMIRDNADTFARSALYENEGLLFVEASVEGAEVYVNGESVGASPVELMDLPLGAATVRIEAAEYTPWEETVLIDLGSNRVEPVLASADLARNRTAREPREREPRPPREPREPREGGSSIGPWVTMGAGVALVGTGVAFGVAQQGTQSDFDDLVAQPVFDRDEAESLRDTGQSQAVLANTFIALGGAAIVGGIVWKIIDGGAESSDTADARDRRARIRVSPSVVGTRGVDLSLTF